MNGGDNILAVINRIASTSPSADNTSVIPRVRLTPTSTSKKLKHKSPPVPKAPKFNEVVKKSPVAKRKKPEKEEEEIDITQKEADVGSVVPSLPLQVNLPGNKILKDASIQLVDLEGDSYADDLVKAEFHLLSTKGAKTLLKFKSGQSLIDYVYKDKEDRPSPNDLIIRFGDEEGKDRTWGSVLEDLKNILKKSKAEKEAKFKSVKPKTTEKPTKKQHTAPTPSRAKTMVQSVAEGLVDYAKDPDLAKRLDAVIKYGTYATSDEFMKKVELVQKYESIVNDERQMKIYETMSQDPTIHYNVRGIFAMCKSMGVDGKDVIPVVNDMLNAAKEYIQNKHDPPTPSNPFEHNTTYHDQLQGLPILTTIPQSPSTSQPTTQETVKDTSFVAQSSYITVTSTSSNNISSPSTPVPSIPTTPGSIIPSSPLPTSPKQNTPSVQDKENHVSQTTQSQPSPQFNFFQH